MTKVTSVKTTLLILGCLGVLAWGWLWRSTPQSFQALYTTLAPIFNALTHGGLLK